MARTVAMIVWNDFRHDARVAKEAATLARAGYEIVVFATLSPGITPERERHRDGFTVERVAKGLFARPSPPRSENSPQGRFGKLLMRVRRLELLSRIIGHLRILWRVRAMKPAVVHAHDVNVLPTAWLVSRMAGAALVYDAHEISTDREGYRAIAGIVRWIEAWLAPKAAFMITTTDLRADHFVAAYGVRRPIVLQNRPTWSAATASRRLAEQLGLPDGRPIVLYQGGLQAGRGLRNLIKAAAAVPQADFVLMGWGRQEPELQALVRSLGIDDRVHVIPGAPLADLPSYTASATIGVQVLRNTCLNHWTTDSNKLFEYLMAGLPVVASDFPEIRRVVQDHDVGVLVDPDDVSAIAAAIRGLLSAPERLAALRGNALTAARTLNWEAQESALVEAYSTLFAPPFGQREGRAEAAL